jgi:hypothetical protein
MRITKAAAAVAAAAMLGSVVLPAASANAADRGTLKICNWSDDFWVDVYADGPSYRDTNLLDGECEDWRVRKGTYELGFDLNSIGNVIGDSVQVVVRIKRNGHTSYRTVFTKGFFSFETNVAKNRKTQVVVNPIAG